jgi:hypothetical protein
MDQDVTVYPIDIALEHHCLDFRQTHNLLLAFFPAFAAGGPEEFRLVAQNAFVDSEAFPCQADKNGGGIVVVVAIRS